MTKIHTHTFKQDQTENPHSYNLNICHPILHNYHIQLFKQRLLQTSRR